MKTKSRTFRIFSAIFLILSLSACDKKKPTVSTLAVTNITYMGASTGGNVTDEGSATVTARGIVWGTNDPSLENNDGHISVAAGIGIFEAQISGLQPNSDYSIRAFASNRNGTSYGNKQEFKTLQAVPALTGQKIFNPSLTYGNVADVDGNTYKTIVIGTQTWFAENLKTTRFNDGSPISLVTGDAEWVSVSSPAYCWYGNNQANKDLMGAKYNWWVASSGKVCPAGWHVPSTGEWSTLINYLGGLYVAGGKLKETGTSHWLSPNVSATNSSGFTSIPSGQRFEETGYFGGENSYDIWWSSTEYNIYKAWYRSCSSMNGEVFESSGSMKVRGFGLRCIKD